MHGPPYCILQTPLDFTARVSNCCCWSCNPVLYMSRLEWIRLLTKEDVPKFISWSRNYPVILFTYAVFNHLFRSSCLFSLAKTYWNLLNFIIQIDFMWYISLHDINRFHVDFSPYLTFTPLAYMILSIFLTFVCLLFPCLNKLSLAFQTLVLTILCLCQIFVSWLLGTTYTPRHLL